MRFGSLIVAAALATFNCCAADEVNELAHRGLVRRSEYNHGESSGCHRTCHMKDARVRREWGDLSKCQRKEYIDAVLCLQEKENITPKTEAPGARTRFDDFVATHIDQTPSIHGTGTFLLWHRYYTWAYEEALRNECGYTGAQPYWDWGRSALDLYNSPLFDGSDTSMSGDGEFFQHNGSSPLPGAHLESGKGGGCVKSGPFKNMTVNLGPGMPNMDTIEPNGDGLGYNPRCLRRDLSPKISRENLRTSAIHDLITDHDDVYWFQTVMQGDFQNHIPGVHVGGHYSIGGDPGADLAVSPGDPLFYFHHAQIDRVYWIWQNQDPETRLHAVSGTHTMFDTPPSDNITLTDEIDLGHSGQPYAISDLLSTTDGPFCYIYG